MIRQYNGKFQLKAVIENKQDFNYTLEVYNELVCEFNFINFPWVLTPSYNTNEEFPMSRFAEVMSWNEQHGGFFRVIGQQHKWIFGPDQKQV